MSRSESVFVSESQVPTLVLVDGHSLAFRSYFAFAKSRDGGLRTSTGIPTSVCFGFLKSLLEVMASQEPQYMAVAFDLGLPTFRHEADETYKADRAETPEEFIPDLENLKELLSYFNLPVITKPGYEADDVLGTLAEKASAVGFRVKILTGDQDLFQLINLEKRITVLHLSADELKRSGKGKANEYGPEEVKAKLGIFPDQVVDYKALCGDKSDNIPGVRGIGEKTAVQLLTAYRSLDEIYAAVDEIKGATQKKLVEGKENAYHSQHLARIVREVPLDLNLEECRLRGFDEAALIPMLERLEFKTFLRKVEQLQKRFGGTVNATQQSPAGKKGAEKTNESEVASQDSYSSEDDVEDPALSFWTLAETKKAQEQVSLPFKVQIIESLEQLNNLGQKLQAYRDKNHPIAWDTETTDLEPRDAELVGIGCCWGSGEEDIAYIPINHKSGNNLDKTEALNTLRPILESADYPKALHNAKFDRLVFRCQGIKLAGVVFDTMLASYVLNPEGSHGLKSLAEKYLKFKAITYEDLVPKGQTIADISIEKVADYCGWDVYNTFHLVSKLREKLEETSKMYQLLLEIEQPLEPVLAEMEYWGIRIDTAYLKQLSKQLEIKLEEIEKEVYQEAGRTFNLGSPKQLSELLFEKIPDFEKKSRKTKTGYSTDAAVLEKLQGEPLVDAIIEHRTLSKLKSTYVDALPELVRTDTGRVHTDFNQTVTTTGRLSSSDPNLQNIPIRTEFSRQIRKAFLPEKDWLMVSADYSQIELRILAHLTEEDLLVEAYKNNLDIHTVTAKLVFEKDQVTADERRLAKTINFGVIYGMGALRFSRSTGVNKGNANEFIKRFNERYPKIFQYLETVKKEAISRGYVETIMGRRRYITFDKTSKLLPLKGLDPKIIDAEQLKKLDRNDAQLLRAAANAPIQGSSADIIKIAMVKLHEVLQNYQARLLLQVHDELVFEVPPAEWEELQVKIRDTMENAVSLKVPLVVDIHPGPNWMEAK